MTSRSFSRCSVLRTELCECFPGAWYNDEGVALAGGSLVQFLSGAELAITALERIDDGILSRLPRLRRVSKMGVGTDMLELDAFDRRGVELVLNPGTNARSVSELALMMMISLLRHVPMHAATVAAEQWSQAQGATLSGRIVGIVGFGNVGRDVAEILTPFGCRLLACDPDPNIRLPSGVDGATLDELLCLSDIVSLHASLNDRSRGMIDARRLALMKPTAVLINTARGGLVEEEALIAALRDGRLGGAGLDTFQQEPPGDSPLLHLPNVLATPHIGGSTTEAVLAMGRAAIAGLTE